MTQLNYPNHFLQDLSLLNNVQLAERARELHAWSLRYAVGEENPAKVRGTMLELSEIAIRQQKQIDDLTSQLKMEHGISQDDAPDSADHLFFFYKNHRGEISERQVTPRNVWFGKTEWHPEPQWLLMAFDHDKGAYRDFAIHDIIGATPDTTKAITGAFESAALVCLMLGSKAPDEAVGAAYRKAAGHIRKLTQGHVTEALRLHDEAIFHRAVATVVQLAYKMTLNPAVNPRKHLGQIRKSVWYDDLATEAQALKPPSSLVQIEEAFIRDGIFQGIKMCIERVVKLPIFATDINGSTRSRRPAEYGEELQRLLPED